MHLLALRRRLRLQPLDRVQSAPAMSPSSSSWPARSAALSMASSRWVLLQIGNKPAANESLMVAVKRWSTRHDTPAGPAAHDLYCPLHCTLRWGERARLAIPNRLAAVRASAVTAVQGRMVANRALMRAHVNRTSLPEVGSQAAPRLSVKPLAYCARLAVQWPPC